jgi:hypothetical protein
MLRDRQAVGAVDAGAHAKAVKDPQADPDKANPRDRVKRQFTADFTFVSTGQEFAYITFMVDIDPRFWTQWNRRFTPVGLDTTMPWPRLAMGSTRPS